jgi:hypothetical protein
MNLKPSKWCNPMLCHFRRHPLSKLEGIVSLMIVLCLSQSAFGGEPLAKSSSRLQVEFSAEQPAIAKLAIDGLGKGEFGASPLKPPAASEFEYHVTQQVRGDAASAAYRRVGSDSDKPDAWIFSCDGQRLTLVSQWHEAMPPAALDLLIDPSVSHVTLLGLFDDDGKIQLPAVMHFPGFGSLRIESHHVADASLGYYSRRFPDGLIRISFPAASRQHPTAKYHLEPLAIHPAIPSSLSSRPLDGFRRSWLNILQLNPEMRCLANHAASDACAFTLYEYSEIALRTPPLADGLSALDLLRQTLDRYAEGMLGYGMVGYVGFNMPHAPPLGPYDFLDSYPSLLIAARNYVHGSRDLDWLRENYAVLMKWADKMLAGDRDGNGLLEYPLSGNSGIWNDEITVRPANWWDTIGFGHEDAYSNALAYQALLGMAEMSASNGCESDRRKFAAAAEKLKAAYYPTFLNPETGVLAGWKSADGQLHDYYFTFVNGMAVTFGLVPPDQAPILMGRILDKINEVGYSRFEFGLPGNLIPVARRDYAHRELRWGGGQREDNLDGFQIYENGGASACFAYYTIQALYETGYVSEADEMLFGMLRGIEKRGFQGRGSNDMSNDWKAWDGTPHGYEGFLVDNYLVLLAVLTRPNH